MKVHFSGVNFSARTGPNVFARRLAIGMSNKGITIADNDDYDVALVFIEPNSELKSELPVVQRLDGIWSKPEEFQVKNVQIHNLYERANGVIFQSQFDKDFIVNHWGEPKRSSVIHNGVEIPELKNTFQLVDALADLRQRYQILFVCSANWHRQKRLQENIELFLHLRNNVFSQKTCALIVMGSNPDVKFADPHVFYTGSLDEEMCNQVFSVSDVMLHLAYADHCPNTVIEALSHRVPVICSEIGGTKELVGSDGCVLREHSVFTNEPFDYDNPPSIDISQLKSVPLKSFNFDDLNGRIGIEGVVNRYIEFLQQILDGK